MCDPGCVAVVMPVGQDPFDVQHQPRPTVRPVWGSQPPDDPNTTSYAADVELQYYLDVSAQETPTDVGVALHSSTPSFLSPHLTAVLSVRNVEWIGSHRRIGKLESLADKIAADSAISSDPSLDSAVTPRRILPWFQIDGLYVSRFSRDFHSGGILDQRLPLPRPVYSAVSEDRLVGVDGYDDDDGYVSDGTCVCPRDWVGFPRAPSLRRLLVSPSHCQHVQLPGFREHPLARAVVRIPNVHRWYSHIQSDIPTDDDDQEDFVLPPDVPYGERRPCRIWHAFSEGNRQLEWFLSILAGRRAGDTWSTAVFDQEVRQQILEIKDLLTTIRSAAWGPQFSKAFTLSTSGKGLLTMASLRNAVYGCTCETGYSYQSLVYHRMKRQRGMTPGTRYHPRPRRSSSSLLSFKDDVPVYPNPEFYYSSFAWRKERARLAGHLRRLSQLLCSTEWTESGWQYFHGYLSRDFPRRLEPELAELNIRRMMGDAAFSPSEAARLNRQLNQWEATVFRVLVWHAKQFATSDCPLLALSVETPIDVHSDAIDTEQSTEWVPSDDYDSEHILAKRVLPYFPQDGNSSLVARFLNHVQAEIRHAAELVMLSTEQQQLRWQPIVLQTHPAYNATIQLAKRRYYSRLARVFAKRLLKRQILHYQGRKPMDKQPLRKDSSGYLYPPSADFKYTLLERSLGLTYSQILVVLIKNIHFVMHDLDAGYSSNSIGDGPTWIEFTEELLDALVSVIPSDSTCDIKEDALRALASMHTGPYHLLTTWNGTSAEAYSLVLISYGHRCLLCSKLFVSEASDMLSRSIACAACCAVTVATRHWVANADNCLVANAVAALQAIRQSEDSTVRILDLSYLSPVKSAVISPSRFLTPQSKLLSLLVCSNCDAFLPSTAPTRFCMKCHKAFGAPVVYSLAEGLELSSQLQATYQLVPPSGKQLLLAGYRLPAEVRAEQELSQLLPDFPDYPLTDPAEISRATVKGVYVSQHTYGEKAAKSAIELIAACEARIGKSDGYPVISYLGLAKLPGLSERLKAQRSLLHLLRDCSWQSIMVAASTGRLLVFDEKKETLSNLSTVEIRNFVSDVVLAPAVWKISNRTVLHKEYDDVTKAYASVLVVDSRFISLVDTHMVRAICKLLPKEYLALLKSQHDTLNSDSMSSVGLISAILASDKSDKSMSAVADRQDLDKELSVKLGANESVDTFRNRFERALAEYNGYSSIRKFSDDYSGECECVEHLLRLLGGGELQRMVSDKFEKKKIKAKASESDPPGISVFWEVLRGNHLLLELQRARGNRSESRDGGHKRKADDEAINNIQLDGGTSKRQRVCRFDQKRPGSCTNGASCPFKHAKDSTQKPPKKVTFDSASTSDDPKKVSKPGITSGKTGKGKGSSKGGAKGGGKGVEHCSRCNLSHKGVTGPLCVHSPCRFCVYREHSDTDHPLWRCPRADEHGNFEVRPWKADQASADGKGGKRGKGDKGAKGKKGDKHGRRSEKGKESNSEPSAKRLKPAAYVQSLNAHQFKLLREQVLAIDFVQNGGQAPAAESAEGESEEVNAVSKTGAAVKSRAAHSTQLLSNKASPSTATATRRNPVLPSEETRFNIAKAQVAASLGGRHKHTHQSLIISEDAARAAPLFWTNSSSGTGVDASISEIISTLEISEGSGGVPSVIHPTSFQLDVPVRAAAPMLFAPYNSTLADSAPTGWVSPISSSLTVLSPPSPSRAVADHDYGDCDWILLANIRSGLSLHDEQSVTTSAGVGCTPHPSKLDMYRRMVECSVPWQCRIYMFDHRTFDGHLDIVGLDGGADVPHEIINSLMTHHDKSFLIDSGATGSVTVINAVDDPRFGAFVLVSKITPLPETATFTTYGGSAANLKVLGWAWTRYCMLCSVTKEVVVLVARSYVAFDASNRFRKIFSPGAMKPFGISFLDGIPTEVRVSGTELDTVIKGPSTDAYLFDTVGHAIKCPHISTHPSLSVLPIVDHTDEGVAEFIQELTMAEVQVLMAAGADRREDGSIDGGFFDPDQFLPQFSHMHSVFTLSLHVQRPLSPGNYARFPTRVPTWGTPPSCEDLGVAPSSYGVKLAAVMSTIEQLHYNASAEFLQGSLLDPQESLEKVHNVLELLQQLGDNHASSSQSRQQDTSVSLNMLQVCAVEAGFISQLPEHLQPEAHQGFPGVISPECHGVPMFPSFGPDAVTLPFLAMPASEHRVRIESLNQNGKDYVHYESADDAALSVCELSTYELLHPYGQVHVWIGPISVVFFKLLYSDRRAHIHVFCDTPVTDVYSLVKPDYWCQFDVHRIHPSALSSDLLSAVLSQGLVDLANVMTLHHECSKDSDSLVCLLSTLPTSNVCLRTECRDGHFTVVKAWPEIDHELLRFKYNPEHADEAAIQRLLQHHDNLQIAQMAKLLEIVHTSSVDDATLDSLQEVCHLLDLHGDSEPPDNDGPDQVHTLSTRHGSRQQNAKTQARHLTATAAAPPSSNRGSSSGKRKLTVMPKELAARLHAKFGHRGRNGLIGALKIFGWLNRYHLPLHIPCAACNITKARRRARTGTVRVAKYVGQIIHADIFTGGGAPALDGSRYAAIFTDDKSGKIIALPIAKKSQFGDIMREFLARLRTLPEEMVLDSGGENVSKQFLDTCYSYCIRPSYTPPGDHSGNLAERRIQTIRDMSMTMLASASMSHVFWPWALQYAAYLNDFIPGKDGICPYLHWHDKLPPLLSLPIFGCYVVYRHANPDRKQQYHEPGHTGRFLGVVADDKTAVWILDSSDPTRPVRRTTEVLQRSYIESNVIDNDRPVCSLDDYAQYGAKSTDDLTDPVDIKAYMSSILQLPSGHDVGLFEEAQRFMRRRRRFLHRRGDMSAFEIEGLISREWRRRARQRLNQEYDPADTGTYLDGLLSDYNSDTEEPDEVDPPEVPSDTPPVETSSTEPPGRTSTSSTPILPPRGADIATGTFLDTSCQTCNGKHFNQTTHQMLLCDICDEGYHRTCIGQRWISPPNERWCCSKCLGKEPNTVIEIKQNISTNPKKSKRPKFVTARVVHINQVSKFGKVEVAIEGVAGTRSVNLCTTRWRLPGLVEEGICYINELNEMVMLKEPKSWKEIQRISDVTIRDRWNAACDAEIQGLKDANVYRLVDRPSGVRCIPLVWVFKIKQPKAGEEIGRFKARCCLLGNIMLASDHDFASPTPRLSTLRYLLSWAAKEGAAVFSADVEQAFLSAPPAEPIYATFPPGYEDPNGKVMFLLKNLYGSTTAPYMFNNYLSNCLIAQGFTPNPLDVCLFTKMVEGSLMMVLCYVDDSAAAHINPKCLDDFYTTCGTAAGGGFRFGQLERSISRFLGFDIFRDPHGFIVSQIPLIEKIFKAAKPYMLLGTETDFTSTPIAKDTTLNSDRPVDVSALNASDREWLARFPYREILGAIGYVALGTRGDISYAYKTHGRWSSGYNRDHCMSLLSFVRYLYQSRELPLILCDTPGPLIGKCDADWNGTGSSQSTSGYICFDGAAPLSWAARTIKASARSTAEAEFMSMCATSTELVYLKRFIESIHNSILRPVGLLPRFMDVADAEQLGHIPSLDDSAVAVLRAQEGIGLDLPPQPVIFTDSMAGKAVAEKKWVSDRMRHIRYSLNFIKSYIASGDLKLAYMKGVDLCADVLTKPFGARYNSKGEQMDSFVKHRREILGHSHYRPQQMGLGRLKLVRVDRASMQS